MRYRKNIEFLVELYLRRVTREHFGILRSKANIYAVASFNFATFRNDAFHFLFHFICFWWNSKTQTTFCHVGPLQTCNIKIIINIGMERQSAQKMINSTQSSSNTECQINFEHELLFHFYHGFWVSTQFNVEYFISRMYMHNFHLKALWAQWIWIAILRDSFLCFSFCICTNIKNCSSWSRFHCAHAQMCTHRA